MDGRDGRTDGRDGSLITRMQIHRQPIQFPPSPHPCSLRVPLAISATCSLPCQRMRFTRFAMRSRARARVMNQ